MRGLILAMVCVAGCEAVPMSGAMFAPDHSGAPTVPAGDVAEDGYQLDSYKDEQSEADGATDAEADDAALFAELGAGTPEDFDKASQEAEQSVPSAAAPIAAPIAVQQPQQLMAPPQQPAWTPANAVTLSWGLRLVSTVNEATPPRAILGLPDGSEEVVKAGDMLPDVGVVVLAVGHGVVQVGQVTREGDHVNIESVFLQSMYPGATAP